jgi:protease I
MANVVIIVGEGFEDSEFQVPCEHLKKAGHEIDVMGAEAGVDVHGKRGGYAAHIDIDSSNACPDNCEALIIPGGFGPDRLRTSDEIVAFVKGFVSTGKPVAASAMARSC